MTSGTSACTVPNRGQPAADAVTPSPNQPTVTPMRTSLPPPPPRTARVPVPAGPISTIPGPGNNLALTVDDGTSPDVVGAYIQFAKDTGARFTFFVTAVYDSWTIHKASLRPLVESGQIQLGSHTWDHPDLTKLSTRAVVTQFERTKAFLHNTFGADGTPYYRPPYGYRNSTVDKIAADQGYTVPTMWAGSLSDSGVITEQYLLECARKYFVDQAIVIGHANHRPVTHVYGQLVDIVRERNLSMVTLDDVFLRQAAATPHPSAVASPR
ncbi:polysaccharide deacetylase family protein [Rhodococcus sp. ABRD24]|uniref:polysaccharide deacetylase family protein n=1 Tax=Rhodococcus sp. ABRD24 TaxID=2507582 RepID=UPI001F611F2E|nr:polysaccharide deacetylase family protein [Rhodococcus sp. ABRD24]